MLARGQFQIQMAFFSLTKPRLDPVSRGSSGIDSLEVEFILWFSWLFPGIMPFLPLCSVYGPTGLVITPPYILGIGIGPGYPGPASSWSCNLCSPPTCKSAQSCPALCDPMDCRLPDSSVQGIFQVRVLEWVAISFSKSTTNWVAWTTEPSHRWKLEVQDQCVGRAGLGGLSPWLADGIFLLCPHMIFSPCVHVPGVSLCVQISSSFKEPIRFDQGPP